MRRALTFALLALLGLSATASAQTAQPLAAQLEPPLPSPVVAGDWPDPDVTLIDGTYYAVATSGGWAPTFRILSSTDLRSWSIAGSVFRRTPGWAKDSFWAPELAALPSGGYALFYSALPKRAWRTRPDGTTALDRGRRARPWYCLGVATAPGPLGPWRDLGRPLRCTPRGTIDPTPVVDGDDLYLVYKEDGNAFGKPTPILLQRLRADGRQLLGAPRELLRNRRGSWEGKVIEAPALVRHGSSWEMLYSGALCCSKRCAYAVGAARAPALAGPWRRYPGNPILRSGNGWRCPGHVSIVGDHVAFHAYRAGGFLAGRQLLIAQLGFGADGWPAVGDGRPLPPADGGSTAGFDDSFEGPVLAPEWEWPAVTPPRVQVGGGLVLTAPPRAGGRDDAAMLARRVGGDRFTATAVVDRRSLRGAETGGLELVRGGPFAIGRQAIGIAVGRHALITGFRDGALAAAAPRFPVPKGLVHLRLIVDGRRVRFQYGDGVEWRRLGRATRSPVGETARIALVAGGARGASARFTSATLVEP